MNGYDRAEHMSYSGCTGVQHGELNVVHITVSTTLSIIRLLLLAPPVLILLLLLSGLVSAIRPPCAVGRVSPDLIGNLCAATSLAAVLVLPPFFLVVTVRRRQTREVCELGLPTRADGDNNGIELAVIAVVDDPLGTGGR